MRTRRVGDDLASFQRPFPVFVTFRFRGPDPGLRADFRERQGNAGDQAAAAGATDQMIEFFIASLHLLGKLEPECALPGNDQAIIKARHQHGVALARNIGRDLFAIF